MDPMTIVALASAAMSLLEKAVPEIQNAVNKGLVDPSVQQDLANRYAALKQAGFGFTRPAGS